MDKGKVRAFFRKAFCVENGSLVKSDSFDYIEQKQLISPQGKRSLVPPICWYFIAFGFVEEKDVLNSIDEALASNPNTQIVLYPRDEEGFSRCLSSLMQELVTV